MQVEAYTSASAFPSYIVHVYVAFQTEQPGIPYASAQSPI